jgi:hypothetical protein
VILSNQVRCNHCGEEPWSGHRHDFVNCGCNSAEHRVSVDGGMDYLRRVMGTKADFTDISIEVDDVHCRGLEAAFTDKTKNDLGKLCNVVRYLRNEMDINVTPTEGI